MHFCLFLFSSNHRPSIVHNGHRGIIFNIVAPARKFSTTQEGEDWRKDDDSNVWTFGHDRILVNTRLSGSHSMSAYYPTIGAPVEGFAFHPLNPNMY